MYKDPCWNCAVKNYWETLHDEYCLFCIDHDYCSYRYDPEKPQITFEEAKQYIAECATELYHNPIYTKRIGERLHLIVKQLDKMKVVNNGIYSS